MGHDFLSIYPAKLLEYVLAISYLLLFIPFWRYVQGGKRPAHAAATKRAAAKPQAHGGARALRPASHGWFQVPAGIHLHPGHTWARLEPDGLVAVGADDFAHKLVGPARIDLPNLGAHVLQGEPALEIGDAERTVAMLSPVDGTVVAINAAVCERPDALDDPYGASWLFKVKAPRLAANLRQLLRDGPARRFVEDAEAQLAMRCHPSSATCCRTAARPSTASPARSPAMPGKRPPGSSS
ncbi:MAG TPA: glycine cleavage system protein H [Anaeromyxobacter sp.]